jgi:DnaJ family protein B protein 12
MRFDTAAPPHTYHRTSSRMKVDYYLNPGDVADYTPSQWSKLDKEAEINLIGRLNVECQREEQEKQQLVMEAQGWFYQDEKKMRQAAMMPMKSCRRLDKLSRR